ncbi:hypothetical protein HQ520_07360 [bacterium]|nr:hypothetical protein [bacterium]
MANETFLLENPFFAAKPVWPVGRELERNLFVGFRAVFETVKDRHADLRVATSAIYRVSLNGQFLAHGPARGPKDHFRVDTWSLAGRLKPGKNLIAFEVASYNVNAYNIIGQPGFLQAEVVSEGRVLASTGGEGTPFEAKIITERVQKVQRYSFQRPFIELYCLNPDSDRWRKDEEAKITAVSCAVLNGKRYLPRYDSAPRFDCHQPIRIVSRGRLQTGVEPEEYWRDRSLTDIGPRTTGFKQEELEEVISDGIQRLKTVDPQEMDEAYRPTQPIDMQPDSFEILDFGCNLSGFVGLRVTCEQPMRVQLTFDEMLRNGDVDFMRICAVQAVTWDLAAGEYDLESFEPYTLRVLKIHALKGGCRVKGVYLRDLTCPDVYEADFHCSDPRLSDIFEAGRETFRQNSVDIFMDCPSRERAGWLCDSYFTARVAKDLCGHTLIEKQFLENFLIPEQFADLPRGMLPMCYPSDHIDGNYIPNWAMWFVIELEEYLARSGDRALVSALRGKMEALFHFFEKYRNSDGLLEKLDRWVFVEWSEANKFLQDVNYPTNMLYAAALESAGRIYDHSDWKQEAARVRGAIREQSFDGEYFVDNALRGEDGALTPTRNRTEVCQYYAFYFGTASREEYPELWERLANELGPDRLQKGLHPEIHPANALPGNYLRMELLSRYGLGPQILHESLDYFLYMAERTGTLWEHKDERASCNHGFASHVVRLLYRDALGCYRVDMLGRVIVLRFNETTLDWCEGRIPLEDGFITIKWRRDDETMRYRAQAPAGYEIIVENKTGLDLVQIP